MICRDCGEKDMRYDDVEKSYHCNNCGSRNIGTYEDMDKTVIDKGDVLSTTGFEIGVLYCFGNHLRGILCNQCKSQNKCEMDYFKNWK